MKTLDCLETGKIGLITDLTGKPSFISRATAIGFTPGVKVITVQNYKSLPLIVYLRDTRIAIDRSEAQRILIDEIK